MSFIDDCDVINTPLLEEDTEMAAPTNQETFEDMDFSLIPLQV